MTTTDVRTAPRQEPTPRELETGWHPDTPVGDTLLRRFVLNLASSWAAAAEVQGGRVCRDERFVAADLGRSTEIFNSAVLRQPLHGQDLDPAVAEVEAFYDAQGNGRVLLWSPWPTPDLRHRGWELEGHPALLLPPAGPPLDTDAPGHLEVRT